ncbi:MAG TPA: hypothetical protein VGR25_08005 [bacterium]|nr:hypothetical protein [bacterium]
MTSFYCWRSASVYRIALDLRPRSYLSHITAAVLNGLVKGNITAVYTNQEQTEKQRLNLPISQEAIDTAFSRPQRVSQLMYTYSDWRLVMLSGKHTGRHGVKEEYVEGETLDITNVPRTLLDLLVRPGYGGGVLTVLQAFRSAQDRFSPTDLPGLLDEMRYVYPYHQAVGFYLERAGYDRDYYEPFLGREMLFDFYIAHAIEDKAYDPKWRVYYPREIDSPET